jgi:Pregnancy-associated plasma protein-A
LFFLYSGSRVWNSAIYGSPNSNDITLSGLPQDSNNSFVSNSINIYVLPKESQIKGGFVPYTNKQILMIGGNKGVLHCQNPGNVNYEIATSRVVCHEMGHCFGLIHTFQDNGDDGISDTPLDYVNSDAGGQGCINTSNCQFTGSCSSCSLSSNPTTNMNNFMSYTIPSCMSYFSVGQLDKMRENLNSSISSVVQSSHEGSPSLMNINYDNYFYANTVNFVSPNYHTIQTNELTEALTVPINWGSSNGIPWGINGSKNVNAWFILNSGQSTTFNVNATNLCGTSSRNITFASYSYYRIYSSTNVKKELTIEFENTEKAEALPFMISIFDEKSTKKDKEINVKEIYEKKGLVDNKKLSIDVSNLTRGNKILHFYYAKIKSKDKQQDFDVKTERIILVD